MGGKYKMHGWQANKKTHLCVAGNIRVIPENEKPPAMRVDIYFLLSNAESSLKFLYSS